MIEEFKPVLRNSNFVYIWLSQILSQLTINIMNFVLLIQLFEKTGSTIATSFLWVSYALPAVLIGPLAAATVDMVDRRKMLMATNLLQGISIFLYALSHRTSFFLLYGIVITYSFLNQFYVPAEAATLPAVLSKKMLPQGNGLFFLTQQAALIVGFGIAGFLNNFLGFDRTLYLCSALLLAAFISVAFLPQLKAEQEIPKDFEGAVAKFFGRIVEGYKFIKENKSILAPFAILMGLQVSLAVIVINVPVIATDILKISLNLAGIYIVVPAAVGAALGALIIPKLIRRGWRKKRMIESSLILMTVLFAIFTFAVSFLPALLRHIVSLMVILLIGLAFIGMVIPAQTFLQEATPGGFRGRVFGNFWFLVTIATIFPTIFAGTVTELFGIRFLLVLLGALAMAALLFSKKYGYKVLSNKVRV